MDKGRIVQIGSPEEIYEKQLAELFVADLIGTRSFLLEREDFTSAYIRRLERNRTIDLLI
ncbi:hypothetical protein ACU8LZ_25600 (plasmid) [Rhizobium leguminosarum]